MEYIHVPVLYKDVLNQKYKVSKLYPIKQNRKLKNLPDILNIVKEIKKENTTVIIVEQNAVQTLKIADYAYVLELGSISTHGPASELINDPKLIEAYLGSH